MSDPNSFKPSDDFDLDDDFGPDEFDDDGLGPLDDALDSDNIADMTSQPVPPPQAPPRPAQQAAPQQPRPQGMAQAQKSAAAAPTKKPAQASVPPKAAAGGKAAAAPAMPEKPMKGLGAVMVRNEFYRDGYRFWQRIAGIQAMAIILLVGLVFMVVNTTKTEYLYFATTEDGRLVPMVPLTDPNLSTPALTSWVAQAATEVMTFGFHDYRKRLAEASSNFTRTGWASFTEALDKSRIIESVEQNQQVVSATPTSAPIITQEGIVNGRYQWTLELPMTVSYQAGSQSRADNLMINLVVVRVPKLESPNGVGIEQWVAIPR
jgi:intracellular multiplication protein IcmL